MLSVRTVYVLSPLQLVRESCQNTLDAREEQQVRIRFVFGQHDSSTVPASEVQLYLKHLESHLKAEGSGLRQTDLPRLDSPMPFLAIEDFGTRGLQGDPLQDDEAAPGGQKRNDFFYFWRNLGRSKKGETDRGRWGLGHTVFAASSRLNSFFGLTLRKEDGRSLLMGQSILKIHRAAGKKYCPYGYFGIIDSEHFATPVEHSATIKKFCQDFGLQRSIGPGLSVVIPYPEPSIDLNALAQAVVKHYFYPLIKGTLAVSLESPSTQINLNSTSLEDEAKKLFPAPELQNILRIFELAKWGLTSPSSEFVSNLPLPTARAPMWDNVKFAEDDIAKLRDGYEANRRLALRIELPVTEKGKPTSQATFDVYLERDSQLQKGELRFVRQDITVANPKSTSEHGVRALVIINEGALAKLLGDAENPAHTEWQERSPKFKDKYDYGAYTLRFVKSAVHQIVRLLAAAGENRYKDLLKDLFFVVEPSEEDDSGSERGTGPNKKKTERREIPKFPRVPPSVKIDRVSGGFKIWANPKAGSTVRLVTVDLAYAVRNGNPFKRYVPEDFELDSADFALESEGVDIIARNKNRLVLKLNGPGSFVKVTGFDEHRDLEIRMSHSEEDSQ
jgi:hypothetical protein